MTNGCYKICDGVAFRLARLDTRCVLVALDAPSTVVGSRPVYSRSMSSNVLPCVSGTKRMMNTTLTARTDANIQKTPWGPRRPCSVTD